MWNIEGYRLRVLLGKFFRLDEQEQHYIEDFTEQLTETQEIPYGFTDSNGMKTRFKSEFERDLLKILETDGM